MPFRHPRLAAAAAIALVACLWMALGFGAPAGSAVEARTDGVARGAERASVAPVADAHRALARVAAHAPSGARGALRHSSSEVPPAGARTITGVVETALAADRTDVRVVAVPAGQPFAVDRWGAAAHLADPVGSGWWVATCDPDGAFTIGPGLDPKREYTLVAAGAGEAAVRPFTRTARAGDDVVISTEPVVALTVEVADEDGARFDWRDHEFPPIGYRIRPFAGDPDGASFDAGESVVPDPISRALLGIPEPNSSTHSLTICAFDSLARAAGRRAEVTVFAPEIPSDGFERFDVVMEPVVHGVARRTLRTPGIGRTYEPTTVWFPPDVADVLRACDWPFAVEFVGAATLRGELGPDSDAWTTDRIAPGQYRIEVHVWRNQALLTEEFGTAPAPVGDRPTVLHLEGDLTAAVGLVPGPVGAAFAVTLDEPSSAHALPRAVEAMGASDLRLPLIWRGDGPAPAFAVSLVQPRGRVALVDAEGRSRWTPFPGQRLRLAPGPRMPFETED